MPLTDDEEYVDVVRLVRGVRGRVTMRMELIMRFGYGKVVPWVRRQDFGLRAIAGPDALELRTPVELHGRNFTTVAEFSVGAGATVPFTLAYHRSHRAGAPHRDCQRSLEQTEQFWSEWSGRCRYENHPAPHWRDAVVRSLITLKCLSTQPTGGIIAAPTTSLPEQLGGIRNWDYRFCWIRDATLTLYALLNSGYREEAVAWREWLVRAAAGRPAELQTIYGIAGERRLTELELSWLPGYEDSRPVRIGNGAFQQLQIDVYGELMDALHVGRRFRLEAHEESWRVQKVLLRHLGQVWDDPDEGIWEVRGPRRHFTHSKLMAWVAFDRAVKGAESFGLSGPVDDWRRLRVQIHEDICRKAFDPDKNSFVQYYGSKGVDAALLLIPQVGFLPPEDARVQGTIAAIERELMEGGLVLRYRTKENVDGLPPGEGAFLACSFWLADCYEMLRPPRRCRAAVRASAVVAQRSRPARRGVRSAHAAPARQLPARLLARGPGQHREQPDLAERAGRAARRAGRRRLNARGGLLVDQLLETMAGPVAVPGLQMAADRGDRGGDHRGVVGEAERRQQIRDHVGRQDEIGDRAEQYAAHVGGRVAIHGAEVGREQILHERHLRDHAPQLAPEPALVRRAVADRQALDRVLGVAGHGQNLGFGAASDKLLRRRRRSRYERTPVAVRGGKAMQIEGQAAIVTGGASGLGLATGAMLASAGCRVALLDIDAAKVAEAAAGIGGIGVQCDVGDAAAAEHALAEARQAHGPATILVNCAGIAAARRIVGRDGPMQLSEFELVIRVNLIGTFNVMRLAAAAMMALEPDAEGARGVIVNTASVAAFDGQIGQSAYAASKGGIAALTLPAAREFARHGIRVVTIAPGIFETPMLRGLPEAAQQALAAAVPFPKRLGRPEEYALLVRQILDNPMLNGETIRLDGALRLAPQ